MRRPSIRSLAGGAAGIASGVIAGVVLTAVSAAGPPAVPNPPALIDAAHVPPLLELLEEPGRLVFVQLGLLEELADGRQVQAAELLPLFEQCLDPFVDHHCAAYSPFRALA